jgi:hypothetical protein
VFARDNTLSVSSHAAHRDIVEHNPIKIVRDGRPPAAAPGRPVALSPRPDHGSQPPAHPLAPGQPATTIPTTRRRPAGPWNRPLGATAGRQARLNTEKPPGAAASGHQVKTAKVEASRLLPGSAEAECGRGGERDVTGVPGRGLSLLTQARLAGHVRPGDSRWDLASGRDMNLP